MGRKLAAPGDIVKKTLTRAAQAPATWEGGMQHAAGTITSAMKLAGPRFAASMQKVINEKLWDKAIAPLTDDVIIAAALKVGGNTWLNGLTTRESKLAAAWAILAPKLQAHMDRIAAMPNVTDADREARMVANLRGMRQLVQ